VCGITGILSLDGARPIDRSLLLRMNAAMVHRGPDGRGDHIDAGRVGLAMRRLAIIDVEGGAQPLSNEDGTVWIVFNGEIYNFPELRKALEGRGHRFRTHTDTEAIVHAYEEYGDGCVDRLRGMFGFAIWDAPRRRLLLARDRVGIKPLFYTIANGQLLWGSEIKCLLQHSAVPRATDARAVEDFFTYLYVPSPRTLFEGINELAPGHVLIAEGGAIRTREYWCLNYSVDETMTESRAALGLRERLQDAVRSHLISDVPLGAFLSGGIDSGAVVGLMAGTGGDPVRTFTIGYEDGGELFDERRNARAVAERFATDHREFVVRPDLEDLLPRLVRTFDQPVGDSSAIPNWYLSQMTREHVKVALSGLGGDEIAAGYERHRGAMLGERLGAVPRWLPRRVLGPILRSLPDSRRGGAWVGRAKRFVDAMGLDLDDRYFSLISAFDPVTRSRLLRGGRAVDGDGDGPRAQYDEFMSRVRDADPLNRLLFADLKLYLPGDLLTLTDRVSMAHSLEVRVPYLDHLVLEYASTIPPKYKLRGLERKSVLKRAVGDLLPDAVMKGRKMGFSVPLTVWFRGKLRPLVDELLGAKSLARVGMLDHATVKGIVDDHVSRRANYDNRIWALLNFVVWHRDFIESRDGLATAAVGAGASGLS
jgi:asparagine synthase (glutamine-hydrolysing)